VERWGTVTTYRTCKKHDTPASPSTAPAQRCHSPTTPMPLLATETDGSTSPCASNMISQCASDVKSSCSQTTTWSPPTETQQILLICYVNRSKTAAKALPQPPFNCNFLTTSHHIRTSRVTPRFWAITSSFLVHSWFTPRSFPGQSSQIIPNLLPAFSCPVQRCLYRFIEYSTDSDFMVDLVSWTHQHIKILKPGGPKKAASFPSCGNSRSGQVGSNQDIEPT